MQATGVSRAAEWTSRRLSETGLRTTQLATSSMARASLGGIASDDAGSFSANDLWHPPGLSK